MDEGAGCQDEGDEPERLAHFLMAEKGVPAAALQRRLTITTEFNGEMVISKITLVVLVRGQRTMMLRYAPGSIVTRERAAVAAARLLDGQYQIPLVVVTNGVEAVLLDTYKGRKLGEELAQLPTYQELEQQFSSLVFAPFTDAKKREREMRILNAFDVDL